MGLDTTHDCWHGSYSAFNRWRSKLCELAGYGALNERVGFGGDKPWPANGDPLIVLLDHSDCEGILRSCDCEGIARRLLELLPQMRNIDDDPGHIGNWPRKTLRFAAGLLLAASKGENVGFF